MRIFFFPSLKRCAYDALATMERQIKAAIPLVAATLRNEQVLALVPDEMRPELERFSEAYC